MPGIMALRKKASVNIYLISKFKRHLGKGHIYYFYSYSESFFVTMYNHIEAITWNGCSNESLLYLAFTS